MKKRALVVLFVLCFIICFTAPVFAIETIAEDNSTVFNDSIPQKLYTEYANVVIQGYLMVSNIDIKTNSVLLSQPYKVFNANDNSIRIVFVFSNYDCIGYLALCVTDDGFASSFFKFDGMGSSRLQSNNKAVSLIAVNESVFLNTENSSYCLYGDETAIQKNKTIYQDTIPEPVSLHEVHLSDNPENIKSYGPVLSVPFVANADDPDGNGLCWAASMASIVMYRTGYTGISAINIYDYLSYLYPASGYISEGNNGKPYGTDSWVMRTFMSYSLGFTHYHCGESYYNVKSIIENDGRPIYAAISGLDSGGNPAAHAVVIKGTDSGYGYYYYKLMDPNSSSTVTVLLSNTSATSFTYVSGSYTYNSWFCHMY